MEILSTGEKIKRARIYKGYTLKDLCKDKISVSKMSCIENDKVNVEEWILDFVAEVLQIDEVYLKQDIKEQLVKNIELAENEQHDDQYEKDLEYNLRFAEEYEYYDICFNIYHNLFNYCLKRDEVEKIQVIISKYYHYWNKCNNAEREMIYCEDMAKFFFKTKEYLQSANYYKNIRTVARKIDDKNSLAKATYDEASCFVSLSNYERAYELAVRLIELVDSFHCNIYRAKAFHMLAMLSLRRDLNKFKEYEQKANLLLENNSSLKALTYKNYATEMFQIKMREQAIKYIEKGFLCYPEEDKQGYVEYMLEIIKMLIENDDLEVASGICDEALDNAIASKEERLIEKAYYYKAIIYLSNDSFTTAEMYLSLSLDSLLKFANKREVYNRYLEMGQTYYKMNNVSESLKYFNFAIKLEKTL